MKNVYLLSIVTLFVILFTSGKKNEINNGDTKGNDIPMLIESIEGVNNFNAGIISNDLGQGVAKPGPYGPMLLGEMNLGVEVLIMLHYYEWEKYFKTLIYDQRTGFLLYESNNNPNIFPNMYDNKYYLTFVDNNCKIDISSNGQTTMLKFRLQVDWERETPVANFSVFVNM